MKLTKFTGPVLVALAIAISPGINAAEDYITVVVKKGDTLTGIAHKYLKDPKKWQEILEHNKIENPDMIRPGMKLKIPLSLLKDPPGSTPKQPDTPPEEVDPWLQPGSGRATTITTAYVNGTVFKLTGDGDEEPIEQGATMFSSDRLITDFMSFAGFKLPGGGWLTIGSDTRFKIESIEEGVGDSGGRFYIKLDQGRVVIFTGEKGLKCRIKTDDISVMMGQGRYQFRAGDGAPTYMEVYKGSAIVTLDGSKTSLSSGKGAVIMAGAAVSPKNLPPAPVLESYTLTSRGRLHKGVKWEHVSGATSYRVEIASDNKFKNIVYNAGYAGSTLDMEFFKQFPKRRYYFRLFGVSKEGLWGLPSMAMQYQPGQ